MDQFNNREIALLIWLAVLIVWVLSHPAARKPLRGLFAAFFRRQILIPIALMAAYIVLLVVGLESIGLWDIEQLKNTIIWSLSVAAASLFRIGHIADDPNYYREAIKDNLRLIVLLE